MSVGPEQLRFVGLDSETHMPRPGANIPRVVCTTAWEAGQNTLRAGSGALDHAADQLRDPGKLICGHNIAFDMAALAATRPDMLPAIFDAYRGARVECTMAREKLIHIARGTLRLAKRGGSLALNDLARIYLDKHLDKENPWRTRFGVLDGLPVEQYPAEARAYALGDSDVLPGIFTAQHERLTQCGYAADTKEPARQAAYAFACSLVTGWGMLVDSDTVVERLGYADALLEGRRQRLQEVGIVRSDKKQSRNMTAIRELISKHYPGGDPPLTEKGMKVCTDEDTVLEASVNSPELRVLATYNKILKIRGFLEGLLGLAPLVHSSIDSLGAETGRTSSYDPNMQQIPRSGDILGEAGADGIRTSIGNLDVRTCFVPRPGFALVSIDFNSQELRTFAQSQLDTTGVSPLAARYKADRNHDPHSEFAGKMLGISYAEALALAKAKDPVFKEKRQHAKPVNFGVPGGLGANGLRAFALSTYDVELSEAESERYRKDWINGNSAWSFFKHVRVLLENEQPHVLPRSGRISGELRFTSACNRYFQGPASDQSKSALFEVVRHCYAVRSSWLYGSRVVMFLHDELLLEIPLDVLHEASKEAAEIMVAAAEVWTPDVPASVEPAAMMRWHKSADPVYENGRLQVWQPKARVA